MRDTTSLKSNRQFCTRLVAQAFRDVGLPIVKNADYCKADDLLNSDKVIIVKVVLRKGTTVK